MKYKATIIKPTGSFSQVFNTAHEAAEWLDSQNNNLEDTSLIETFDEAGNKKDGFFYTEKAK